MDAKKDFIEEVSWDGNVLAVHQKDVLRTRMFPHKISLVVPQGKTGFIFARRGKRMEPFSDTWVCAIGGKLAPGESYFEAAKRESLEESGIELEPIFVARFVHDEPSYQVIAEVFTTAKAIEVSSLVPDPREIQYFRELSIGEIQELLELDYDSFAPTLLSALQVFLPALNSELLIGSCSLLNK